LDPFLFPIKKIIIYTNLEKFVNIDYNFLIGNRKMS